MAKKSAVSKGYRKQAAKKPYLSKRDIAIVCVIVALVAVGAFFLFRYDDGALKVQDGAVVTEGDNWLIANGSNMQGGRRYYKLGEIGEIDGYAREKGALSSDGNIPEYSFTPAGDGGDVTVTVTCGHGSAEAMAKYSLATVQSIGISTAGEIQTGQLAGQDVRYYSYATDYTQQDAPGEGEAKSDAQTAEGDAKTDAEAAEGDASRYSRAVAGYIDASHNCCVIVNVVSKGNTDDDCLPDDALVGILENAVSAVKVEG
jgi:hypothetical protein